MTTSATDLLASIKVLASEVAVYRPDGDEAALSIDLLTAMEELRRALEGAQTAVVADFTSVSRAEAATRGVQEDRVNRGIGEQVALACAEPPHRGRKRMQLAMIAERELPHAYTALRQGRITLWHLTNLATQTTHLDADGRRQVDAALEDEYPRLTPHGVNQRARALADRLDPAAAVLRRRHAENERCVSIRPAPDTMTWVTALLPVKDGVAVHAALAQAARAAQAAGDPRSRGQVMADTFTQRITGREQADGQPVRMNVVITDQALFGETGTAAHLDGYGPIPAELARELTTAATAGQVAQLRRLYANPEGHLVAMESRSRTFPTGLAELIRLRDHTCRTPWCDAPIRHTDHVHPHAEDGPTSYANGQGLCEACNHAKQAPGWRQSVHEDAGGRHHVVTTTTPTGHTYASHPPAPTATPAA